MALIKQLKSFLNKTSIYPKTVTKAVYDDDGNRLDNVLDGLKWSDYIVLSSSNPQIVYRYNSYMVEVNVNTNVNSYPSETELATLPLELAPMAVFREYRGNGHISIDVDGLIYANNVDPWTVANFMFSRR